MCNAAKDWAYEQKFPLAPKAVLCLLAEYANKNTGLTWCSQQTIAQKTGANRNTVKKALNLLKERGAITPVAHRNHVVVYRVGPTKQVAGKYQPDWPKKQPDWPKNQTAEEAQFWASEEQCGGPFLTCGGPELTYRYLYNPNTVPESGIDNPPELPRQEMNSREFVTAPQDSSLAGPVRGGSRYCRGNHE